MTENEAIKGLETLRYQCKHNGECGTCNICCSAIPLVIQALEEIQQYRAIGTIEELKTLKEKSVAKKQGNINDFDSHLKLSKAGFLCCSSTNKDIRYPLISLRDLDYCPRCGQKLDWQ